MDEKNAQVRLARFRAGLKAKDLAERVGISAAYLSQIENGVRSVSDDLFSKIIAETSSAANSFSNSGSISASNNGGGVVIGSPGAVVGVGGGEGCDLAGRVRDLEERVSALERLVVKLVSERDVP